MALPLELAANCLELQEKGIPPQMSNYQAFTRVSSSSAFLREWNAA